jgi:hypothetical protein
MNIPKSTNILNENWMIYRFSYSVKHFEKLFDSSSKFSTALISGNQIIGNKTNRKFFKEDILGGFYFSKLSDDFLKISFIFFLEFNPNKNNGLTSTNVKLRIKKILNTKVESFTPEQMDESIRNVLLTQTGRNLQRFGNQINRRTN